MKQLTIVILCVSTLQSVFGSVKRFEDIKECVAEQGYTNTREIAMALLAKKLDTMPDVSREKVACAVACAFKKNANNNGKSIDSLYADVINEMVLPDDLRKQMLETLNTCKIQAENDDCKFLNCVKMTEPPFLEIIVITNNIPNQARSCIKDIGVTTEDIRTIKKAIYHSEPADETTKNKMSCLLGCAFSKTRKPDEKLSNIITDAINSDPKVSADKKKILLDSLSTCVSQVGEKDDCKLLECLKIYDDSFISISHAIQKKIDESI